MDIRGKGSLWQRVAFRRYRVGMIAAMGMIIVAGCETGISPADRCISNADCDDGIFCNGEEYCSIDENDVASCYDRTNPCTNNPVGCNEATDTCEP